MSISVIIVLTVLIEPGKEADVPVRSIFGLFPVTFVATISHVVFTFPVPGTNLAISLTSISVPVIAIVFVIEVFTPTTDRVTR